MPFSRKPAGFRIQLAAVAALAAAIAVDTAQAQLPARPAAQNLPEAHARARSERVSAVRYELDFELTATDPEYAGTATIRFDLAGPDGGLTLDFAGGSVNAVEINGRPAPIGYNGFFLELPAERLRTGANSVRVDFRRPYSADGSGLYRFVDPEDGRAYLYTDFEPFDQNRLFPSFDQPDLKGSFTTTVRAPASWTVIANTREVSVTSDGDERVWRFAETLPISTYVYALHAGEYHVWESAADGIPLRLFAREALVPYVYPAHWFEPTALGFAFYQTYFETPYPFGKYDQVIVPHFNSGAMENVAAVTFSERYLRRGGITRQDRRAIASVILHEMAHMWFGDLVTMDWWNGLWLNESFATVMAVLALTSATEFDDEWQQSYLATVRAYAADERDTTHPVELAVPDTDSAFANFDTITYQKGSATLVQLMHLVGPENFRRGVADYLAEHAYSNTTIDDFLGAISRAADLDLGQWARDWLLTPGANSVEVELECANGAVESLAVVQSAPEQWPLLRTHRTQLGLYRFEAGEAAIEAIPLTYAGGRTEVAAANSLPCPQLVYPNHGDWDYVRVRLAPDALDLLDGRLQTIADPLARLMLWQNAWDAVLDARMPVSAYVEFALANQPDEQHEAAVRQVLNALAASTGYIEEIVTDPSRRTALLRRIEEHVWRQVESAVAGSDLQIAFYDAFVRIARTGAATDRIADLLTGASIPPSGISIDSDRRWTAIGALVRAGHPDAERLRSALAAVDRSDNGRLRSLAMSASRPDEALKRTTLAALLDANGAGTLADYRAIAGGMFPGGQHELQLALAPAVFDGLAKLSRTREPGYVSAYAGSLIGPLCSTGFRELLESAITNATDSHPLVRRSLLDTRFETDRCLRMRAIEAASR